MCGICGIVDFNGKVKERRHETVTRMNEAIVHRGPDGEGRYTNEFSSLAMRRLSIIDLDSGDQPIWNEDMSCCVFMNGEIYNYRQLKSELQEKGHKFKTASDTEVLVHLYEEEGVEMVSRLKGMFTFCIYDVKHQNYIFGRDRFGEKPFYYHYLDGQFSFSSEAGSLLENPSISRRLNLDALHYYLGSSYLPDPITLVKGVHTLPPGHTLVLTNDGIDIQSYFTIDYSHTGNIKTEAEAITHITPYLHQAVERQSVSDVPIGAFLSGGNDSSSVCALLQANSDTPIDTFTVKFEEATYDESSIAKEVAKKIGSNHHEITISNSEFSEEMFWEIVDHVGLPFPDSSAIPVYAITKEIRKHVKVALSGDGGDEIFAGYPVYGWWDKINKINRVPKPLRTVGLSLLNKGLIPLGANQIRQIARGVRASLKGQESISLEIHRMFFDEELESLLKNNPHNDFSLFTEMPPNFKSWSTLRKSMYHRLKYNLVNDMLIKVDRMSMANSLEVRAPFLDPDLYNASLEIADDLLYRNGTGKYIIRQAMRKYLPDAVFDHPKSGFSIPLHKYEKASYRRLVDELISPESSIYHLFDSVELEKLKHLKMENSNTTSRFRTSHQLWTVLLLFGWAKRFKISA